jgi:ABC-type uncharacterized transport system permease subunit
MLSRSTERRVIFSLLAITSLFVILGCLVTISVLARTLVDGQPSKAGRSFLMGFSNKHSRIGGVCLKLYKIQSGETLTGIALKFQISIEQILLANSLQVDYPTVLAIPCPASVIPSKP